MTIQIINYVRETVSFLVRHWKPLVWLASSLSISNWLCVGDYNVGGLSAYLIHMAYYSRLNGRVHRAMKNELEIMLLAVELIQKVLEYRNES